MILRDMPATWNPTFRPRFYARWGKENFVISARTRRAEYPDFEQRLSIKAAYGGAEDYFVDGRRIAVDDDTFLILNEERTYASSIRAAQPVHSFSLFFRPGMAAEVLASLNRSSEALLGDPQAQCSDSIEFSEHVRPHDRRISPVLRFIRAQVDAGIDEEMWLEEQMALLLERMIGQHRNDLECIEQVPGTRRSTRRELYRRAGLGFDFIHAHYREPVDLATIASAACLSPYHFLRVFRAIYGETPSACLRRKRSAVAARLLKATDRSVLEVAGEAGYGSRASLFRQAVRQFGVAPSALRPRRPGH